MLTGTPKRCELKQVSITNSVSDCFRHPRGRLKTWIGTVRSDVERLGLQPAYGAPDGRRIGHLRVPILPMIGVY